MNAEKAQRPEAAAASAHAAPTSSEETSMPANTPASFPVPVSAVPRRNRAATALTVARVVLALFLGFSAAAKLGAHESAVASFDRMGWSDTAMYTIGALEMAGAVALLIPLLAGVAALALAGLLAGAAIVQLTLLDPPNAPMPALLVVVVLLIARDRRERTAELFALLRGRGRAERGGQ
ncbi:DoxX family protein [Streptomyces sp. B1I3]|uniref:DoxX family protein n=1 Tax=Streptomyces sp. B1I3 TaxID=3042264 RepID=UPI002788B13B|nr:DoxX family protein [Streptomyces sp. B1I3]MDQ0796964.1 putative membrane protein YphA (DoxX/SURF4 family) [Streptomyces sp. B1I3]